MPILEDLKEYTERATGLWRPGERNASELARERKPHAVRFKDDGVIPNHPRWPLIIYRSAVDLDESHDPAAVIEDLFEVNGWGDTWRKGIYDYVRYHSRTHELLGIAREGTCPFRRQQRPNIHSQGGRRRHPASRHRSSVPLGGRRPPRRRAYPPTGTYDECTTVEHRPRALKTIPNVPQPRRDRLYGTGGPLSKLWKKTK
jgi:uncharacterized protein YjlB